MCNRETQDLTHVVVSVPCWVRLKGRLNGLSDLWSKKELWSSRLKIEELEAGRHDLYRQRHAHVLKHMRRAGATALLLLDSNDITYATGARNMTLFTMRTPARYLLVLGNGHTVLFEYMGCEHLADGLPTISEIRPALGLDIVSSGGRTAQSCARFAVEIASIICDFDPSIDRVHLDRFPWRTTDALRLQGFELADANEVLSPARAIKLAAEIPYFREAMTRIDAAVNRLETHAEPDRTESEVWAEFHYELMAKEGQYVSTRLFQSGANTFPYFKEAGGRPLEQGDLLCLDTDAISYENYCVDYSRTFLCGDGKATDDQRLLYGRAREQLEYNAALLKPEMPFRELAQKAWAVPKEHRESRYYCVGHGLGMSGEWPNIPHHQSGETYPLAGALKPGMIICLESYVGWDRSNEGVKLEDQFLILEDRVERMSSYPFDERLG